MKVPRGASGRIKKLRRVIPRLQVRRSIEFLLNSLQKEIPLIKNLSLQMKSQIAKKMTLSKLMSQLKMWPKPLITEGELNLKKI